VVVVPSFKLIPLGGHQEGVVYASANTEDEEKPFLGLVRGGEIAQDLNHTHEYTRFFIQDQAA
jgi:hypothetical protein